MTVFRYDKSWEGLLTAVFDAYARRQFPERLLADGEPLPLFCDGSHQEAPPESVQSWVLSKEMYCVPPRPLNSSVVSSTENISSSGGAGASFPFLEHPQIIIADNANKNKFFIVRFI